MNVVVKTEEVNSVRKNRCTFSFPFSSKELLTLSELQSLMPLCGETRPTSVYFMWTEICWETTNKVHPKALSFTTSVLDKQYEVFHWS